MKYLIISVTLFSMCFSGGWLSYDLSYNLELSVLGYSVDDDVDDGAFTIGYESPVSDNIFVGISYDVMGATAEELGDSEMQVVNLYVKYSQEVNEGVSLWGSLGYNIPTGDFDDFESGLSYGVGATMTNGIGLYYMINNSEFPNYYADDYYGVTPDITLTRIGLSYSF